MVMEQDGIECFMMTPLTLSRRYLRRYRSDGEYFSAMNLMDEVERHPNADGCYPESRPEVILGPDWKQDARWPICGDNGKLFIDSDPWQIFERSLWMSPSGQKLTMEEFDPGSMFNAEWLQEHYPGPDGLSLHVILPNGAQWHIDGRASNCTMPNDRIHRCWVRHGNPPNLTVDKIGNTCQAGAGSILSRQGTPIEWHGFLRNGRLVK